VVIGGNGFFFFLCTTPLLGMRLESKLGEEDKMGISMSKWRFIFELLSTGLLAETEQRKKRSKEQVTYMISERNR
jgi:hypothetical protein